MSKPGADPTSGISLGDALRLPKRHPACRRREAQPGSCTERENLNGDAKGKTQAAQTARPKVPMRRLGADCFVLAMKRSNARGAMGVGHRHLTRINRQREEPDVQWKASAFVRWHEPDDARVSCPVLRAARGAIPRPTRQKRKNSE